MEKIEVSICIPVYNAEEYIKETINSVLNQSFKNFELIILDNNSTDETVKVIKEFKDNRIKLYQNKKNLGMVKNWNECLKKVKGEYVHFVCSDDILHEDCILKKIQIIKQDKDIVMVGSNTDIINSNGKKIFTRRFCYKNKIKLGEKVAKRSFRTKNIFGEPSNILFRKSVSDLAGKFNEKLSYTPDWEYWMRLTKYGKIAYISQSLTKYRVLPTSGTAYLIARSDIMRKDDRIFMDSIKKIYNSEINFIDIFMHKLVGTIRLYAKFLFIKIFAKKR